MYCRSLLDAGRSRFLCPYISQGEQPVYCGKEWDYIDVRRLAVLTDDEILEFERKITKNYLVKAMGVQECPKCNSMVERSDKKHIRVICPLCSKDKEKAYEFCWHCLHEWTNSSESNKCGKYLTELCYNRPCAIYINFLTWLRGSVSQDKLLCLVVFSFRVSESVLEIERQRKLKKFAILTRKPRIDVRLWISGTWPIKEDYKNPCYSYRCELKLN